MRHWRHRLDDVIKQGRRGAAGQGRKPHAQNDKKNAPSRANDVCFDGKHYGDIPVKCGNKNENF